MSDLMIGDIILLQGIVKNIPLDRVLITVFCK